MDAGGTTITDGDLIAQVEAAHRRPGIYNGSHLAGIRDEDGGD